MILDLLIPIRLPNSSKSAIEVCPVFFCASEWNESAKNPLSSVFQIVHLKALLM